jgi:parvulin-like peptidyl-prolyl isomerase
VISRHYADSLADIIISRINAGTTTFEDMAQTFSMGGEAATQGDLGWVAIGGMIPEIEQEIAKRKKGEIFKLYTSGGVHILRKTDTKEDTGYALILRIFL